MKVDNCFNLLDSPELLCLSRCLSKKTLLIWIAWTMCTHMATISCDLGKDHKEQMPSNAGSNRACRTHSISDKAFDFAISSREAPILPMPDWAASKRAWEFVSYHHSSCVLELSHSKRSGWNEQSCSRNHAAYWGHRTWQKLPCKF